ncbi:MAG: oligopeptide/dipeptide ABC transporter ATP-binding protein, partial [Deltaproteobacteria bacterium]
IFASACHPYTLPLLAAVPALEKTGRYKEVEALKGEVSSPFNPPPGCKFQARCPLVEDLCRKGVIALYPAGEAHFVRCWKVVGKREEQTLRVKTDEPPS